MKLEEKLSCLGYFGFGSGYAIIKLITPPGSPLYCNSLCPLAAECWDKHRARTAFGFPTIVDAFKEMAKEVQGHELVEKWFEVAGGPDPYNWVMAGNVEDGCLIGARRDPKERGQLTIQWPIESVER